MDSKPLSVLVTGSSGFIGSHVIRQLHAAGHRVTALDIHKPKFPLPDGVEFRQCDIRQDHLPNRVFDAVVHLTALASVRPSMTNPLGYYQTNVNGTMGYERTQTTVCCHSVTKSAGFRSSVCRFVPEPALLGQWQDRAKSGKLKQRHAF
jgi:UDP-glucose 4-epimerase